MSQTRYYKITEGRCDWHIGHFATNNPAVTEVMKRTAAENMHHVAEIDKAEYERLEEEE